MTKLEEYQTILDYLNYILDEYKDYFKKGYAKEVIEAQATYYQRLVNLHKEKNND